MSPRSPGTLAILTLGALLVAALGAGGTATLLQPPQPASLSPAKQAEEQEVHTEPYEDAVTANLTLTVGEAHLLRSTTGGTLTSSMCAPGKEYHSGEVTHSLDDSPILALATSMPLWRSLHAGDRGRDVEAVQTELNRLGTGIQVDGVLGRDSYDVLAALFAAHGYPGERLSSVPLDRIMWLPQEQVTVQQCEAQVGDPLEVAAPLASLGGALLHVEPALGESTLVPGKRVLQLSPDLSIPLDDSGRVTEPEALTRITQLSGYAEAVREKDPLPLSGRLVLAEPLTVVSVPATALTAVREQQACVWSESQGFPVTIVSSQLGQSLVLFAASELPATVTIEPADNSRGCAT